MLWLDDKTFEISAKVVTNRASLHLLDEQRKLSDCKQRIHNNPFCKLLHVKSTFYCVTLYIVQSKLPYSFEMFGG